MTTGQLPASVEAELVTLLGGQVARATTLPSGGVCTVHDVTLTDGRRSAVKTLPGAAADFFTVEADGLAWLRAAGGAPVPVVRAASARLLAVEWVESTPPDAAAAERFARDLAATHAAGAESFGWAGPSHIGSLRLENRLVDDWPTFWAEQRVLPMLRAALDHGAVDLAGAAVVEQVCAHVEDLAGPAERPARVHGDLWSGNVVWGTDGRARLIDPSAHGGHRETDLAMLAFAGAPHLGRFLAAYDEAYPLAPGWRARTPLHQLFPLLVHAVLFGGAYGPRAVAAAHAALRST